MNSVPSYLELNSVPSYLELIIAKIRQKILNIKYGTVRSQILNTKYGSVRSPKKQNKSNWPYILLIIISIAVGVGVYYIENKKRKKINE